MASELVLHELTGSPNNVKVRIALGYKKLDYERKPLSLEGGYPGDRSGIVAISGQPRTPVLVHGSTVLFDSGAILRYLDANFPKTPRLYSADHAEFGEIEGWESFARCRLGEPIAMFFGVALSGKADPAAIERANALLEERVAEIEKRLGEHDYLVGDRLTSADVVCAAALYVTDLTEQHAAASPIAAFFHANAKLGASRERTRAWIRRLMAHDPVLGARG